MEVGRLSWNRWDPFPGLRSWPEYDLSTSIHLCLFPDCGCHVISCLTLLLLWFLHHDGLNIWTGRQNKPLFLQVPLVRQSVTTMRQITNKLSWGQCTARQRNNQSFYVYFVLIQNDSRVTAPHPLISNLLQDLEVKGCYQHAHYTDKEFKAWGN